MDAPAPGRSHLIWRTSSYSNNGGACVEVARNLPGRVLVRDSKDRTGPVLTLAAGEWQAFLTAVKAGRFAAD